MAKIMTKAGTDVIGLLSTVVERYHPELGQLDVRIAVTMVEVDSGGEIAITCGGNEAVATIARVSRRRRVHWPWDIEIMLDAVHWGELSIEQRVALLDHELTHVVIRKSGPAQAVVMDSDGRPKLGLRPDDFAITGFWSCVERHGPQSAEVESIMSLWNDGAGQLLFPFAKAPGAGPKAERVLRAAMG